MTHITREKMVGNLTRLHERKTQKLRDLRLWRERKVGQIRALNQGRWLLKREIQKEERDLRVIERDIAEIQN